MRIRTDLGVALTVAATLLSAAAVYGAPPATASAAALELIGVGHALHGRTLVIAGWVRNVGPVSIGRLVIDAPAYAPDGTLAGFGSDGIPWNIAPNGMERFQVYLPLGRALVRDYTVSVTSSRPHQVTPALVSRSVELGLYRTLLISEVRLEARMEPGVLVVRASADALPVTAAHVRITLLLHGVDFTLETLALSLSPGAPLRVPTAPAVASIVAARVVDVTLDSSW